MRGRLLINLLHTIERIMCELRQDVDDIERTNFTLEETIEFLKDELRIGLNNLSKD